MPETDVRDFVLAVADVTPTTSIDVSLLGIVSGSSSIEKGNKYSINV